MNVDIMMKRYFSVLMIWSCCLSFALAQTPVEKIVTKYEDVKGSKELVAKGAKMVFARALIKQTPVAPIADDVTELAVLKMANASRSDQKLFYNDLMTALKGYLYCGRHDTRNGTVDVYIMPPSKGMVKELVIYNPAIYSLNSLYGEFSVESLLSLTGKSD